MIHKLLDGWWVVRYRSPTSATADKSQWSPVDVAEEQGDVMNHDPFTMKQLEQFEDKDWRIFV